MKSVPGGRASQDPRHRSTRSRTPGLYRLAEIVSECLIYFMIVFTPWAFGTTQPWAIWTMNLCAYVLGCAGLVKWWIRRSQGYQPDRWGHPPADPDPSPIQLAPERSILWARHLKRLLAAITLVILAQCLISAINARADYLTGLRRFEYFEAIPWLPSSYDATTSWEYFWMYLGLATFFWSFCDWVTTKTARERRQSSNAGDSERQRRGTASESDFAPLTPSSAPTANQDRPLSTVLIPERLRRVLWILCLNGGLLALEAILQRLDGTNKLLWLVQPRINKDPDTQFGPYAYRSNAAQYLNLVWPVCLGFWLTLRRQARGRSSTSNRLGSSSSVVLIPCAVLMAAGPIVSTSRGGALAAMGMIVLCLFVVLRSLRRESAFMRIGAGALFAAILALGASLGWTKLSQRLERVFEDQMSHRTEIYANAIAISRDFPWYGTGPGSFGALYQLYRDSPEQVWAHYVHDDWLETRICLGWLGFSLVILLLVGTWIRGYFGAEIRLPREFLGLTAIATGTCLLHAKFDFPFQIYSILFVFLLLQAILMCTSWRNVP